MKTKERPSRFDPLRLRRQSATLLLVNLFFNTICKNRRVKSRRPIRVVAAPRPPDTNSEAASPPLPPAVWVPRRGRFGHTQNSLSIIGGTGGDGGDGAMGHSGG